MLTSSRHLAETLLFALLMGLSWLTWQHAHVVHPDLQPIHLREEIPRLKLLSGQNLIQARPGAPFSLTLTALPDADKPCAEISLAEWVGQASAHIRVKVAGEALVQGTKEWECGRIVLAWRDPAGKILPGHYSLAGASGHDGGETEVIASLDKSGSPSILIQNLGQSGAFQIEELTIQPIKMRAWVPWAAAGMMFALGILVANHFHRVFQRAQPNWRRCGLAALLFTAAIWGLVLPGPWRPYHSILLPFDLGVSHGPSATATETPATGSPAASIPPEITPSDATAESGIATTPASPPSVVNAEVPGRMDGGWFWETYMWLKKQVRPLIHLGIFSGLAFLFRLLLGQDSAWRPAALLAIATESMQALFGFGFQWDDLLDLAINGVAIFIGLRLATLPFLANLPLIRKWTQKPAL